MQATRIIAVRHGETAWNVDTRIQGHLDIALNATGQWQARRLAQALRSEDIAAIYSSDLARARETAQAVATLSGAPLLADPGLRERSFGDFEGRTFAQIERERPEDARRWRQRDPGFVPAGGESLLMLQERIAQTVATLAARHDGEQILLVAHGGVMDMLYRLATHLHLQAPRTWQLTNAAINRLLWTGESLALVGWADTRHLDGASRDESLS
ncbi:histidine phosphatase family protein [Comamonas faecalis]|uniref:Histidine phosphatase family protein n=1 Tax=Comamonas faecalis TaxID=1387849 RepID=A0ABP7QRF0_9BURK